MIILFYLVIITNSYYYDYLIILSKYCTNTITIASKHTLVSIGFLFPVCFCFLFGYDPDTPIFRTDLLAGERPGA